MERQSRGPDVLRRAARPRIPARRLVAGVAALGVGLGVLLAACGEGGSPRAAAPAPGSEVGVGARSGPDPASGEALSGGPSRAGAPEAAVQESSSTGPPGAEAAGNPPDPAGRSPIADSSPAVRSPERAAHAKGKAPPVSGPRPAAPDVDLLLARAESTYAGLRSLRARFRQTIHVPLLDRRREGTGLWYQKGRSHFRMDFQDPPEDLIVADGAYLWLYYPSTNPKQVIRSELEGTGRGSGTADLLAQILSEARSAYRGTYVGTERVDGVETHVVSLQPLRRSPYREVRVWIGTGDLLVRRFQIQEENETVRTVTLAALETNVELPDSLFRFVPPSDADVFAG